MRRNGGRILDRTGKKNVIKLFAKDGHIIACGEEAKSKPHEIFYSKMLKRWICSCYDFQFRKMKNGGECKHIMALVELINTATEMIK